MTVFSSRNLIYESLPTIKYSFVGLSQRQTRLCPAHQPIISWVVSLVLILCCDQQFVHVPPKSNTHTFYTELILIQHWSWVLYQLLAVSS